MKLFASSLIALGAAALVPTAADATITVNINQVGSNVVATGSGSLSLSGLSLQATNYFLQQAVTGAFAYVGLGDPNSNLDFYTGLTGPSSFGSGSYTPASSSSGFSFAMNGSAFGYPVVFVPDGYVSGTVISDTATWLGQSFSSLGLTPGTYTWYTASGAPDVIIHIGAAVPEPATWMMMILGFGAIGFGMRRRRKLSPMAFA